MEDVSKAYSQKRKDLALLNGLADRLKAGKASKLAEKKTIKALKVSKKAQKRLKTTKYQLKHPI